MTLEQAKEYDAWWDDPATPDNSTNREIFEAGWDLALSNRQAEGSFIVNQVNQVKAELRDKIMDKAVEEFRNGFDETARLYRDLVTELFPKAPQ